jgi:hypothetical protein
MALGCLLFFQNANDEEARGGCFSADAATASEEEEAEDEGAAAAAAEASDGRGFEENVFDNQLVTPPLLPLD